MQLFSKSEEGMSALPFAVLVTANFGIDYIKAGAAGKVFQVLWFQKVSPRPVPRVDSSKSSRKYAPVMSNLPVRDKFPQELRDREGGPQGKRIPQTEQATGFGEYQDRE